MLYKIVSFNEWVRYFVWNFKGALWNSTQNISAIQWKMCILLSGENLRALRFKSVEAILKQMRTMKPIQTNLVYMGVYVCVMVLTKWWYIVLCLSKNSKYVFALLFRNFLQNALGLWLQEACDSRLHLCCAQLPPPTTSGQILLWSVLYDRWWCISLIHCHIEVERKDLSFVSYLRETCS